MILLKRIENKKYFLNFLNFRKFIFKKLAILVELFQMRKRGRIGVAGSLFGNKDVGKERRRREKG